jgi:hypothetical protein
VAEGDGDGCGRVIVDPAPLIVYLPTGADYVTAESDPWRERLRAPPVAATLAGGPRGNGAGEATP